jgi:cell surface protein SprA
MIGVRYPHKAGDQGATRSVEVWADELRLTDFNEKGGWAANARITTKLADLGTLSVAGSILTPGFGSIEQKVNQRSKEEIKTYDISSNLELGKFFPAKSGVQIPMYVGYSESFTDPEYNPLDPDIPLKAALDNAKTKAERSDLIQQARDYVMRRSINFTNVRINKQQGKPHFYDVSNWSVNYAYNETYAHNISTERSIDKRFMGGVLYNYNGRPKTIQPFQKSALLNNKFLRIVKDFNFNLGPTSMGFRSDMSRNYREITLRDINRYGLASPTTVNKDFLWNRNYQLSYDLTRSLKLDFTATNVARIDEPQGVVSRQFRDTYQVWKDSVWTNLKRLGRTTQYYHDINLTYTLPINKIPFLDWTSSSVRYSATYGWDAAPMDTFRLGNTIKNSNSLQFSGQFTLTTLYNKIPYFKHLMQPPNKNAPQKKKTKEVTFERTVALLKAQEPRLIFHKLGTDKVVVKVYNKDNKLIKGKTDIINDNKISFTPDSNYTNTRVVVVGTVDVSPNPFILILENSTRILLGVKNVSFSYSQTEGSYLPGYLPKTQMIGMERDNGMYAPGLPFIFGVQDKNFPLTAIKNGWLTQSKYLNTAYLMTHNETFNGRVNIEPVNGLKIELTTNRTYTKNESSYYIADGNGNYPDSARNFTQNGNFSMSFISIGSAFEKMTSTNYEHSATFEKFKSNRIEIMRLLAQQRKEIDHNYDPNNDENGKPMPGDEKFGYNSSSQQVLIPAFLAAYGGVNPSRKLLRDIPSYLFMRPNWKINFEGLSQLDFVKRFARSVNIGHSYRATYNIGNFQTNPDYDNEAYINLQTRLNEYRDLQNNFIPRRDINSVAISEQFGPLINLDVTWKNSLSTRFELRKTRNVVLSLSSYQVTETNNNDLVIGAGYKFKDVQFIVKTADSQKGYKSDLNLTADVSIRDNKVVVRKLDGIAQAAQGQNVVTIKVSADYNLSESFNLRLFYDRIVNTPFISISYPTANTNIGFSIRFTLVQ